MDNHWYQTNAALSLARLMPRMKLLLQQEDYAVFENRVRQHFPRLFRLLHQLYGHQYYFFFHLETILSAAARSLSDRPT